jgi:predicted nucleic acid-binding protein
VILVDTSVWIDFFAGRDARHVSKLEQLIRANENLALCGIVLTEILQGIADDGAHRRGRRRDPR